MWPVVARGQVHKLLAYLDGYKRSLSRPPPALICGDFNGERASSAVQFLKRYGWQCSYSRHVSQRRASDAADSDDASSSSDVDAAATAAVTDPEGSSSDSSIRWVSHYTHEQQVSCHRMNATNAQDHPLPLLD